MREKAKEHLDKTKQAELTALLEGSSRIGLLVNERFLNIPARVADPLFSSLAAEIKRAEKRDPSYNFQQYIMVAKVHKSKDGAG